jgi:high affinity Mn2+ porin
MKHICNITLVVCLSALALRAQDNVAPPASPDRWNLFYQATSIGQYHGNFHAAYSGENSLANTPERDVSLTTTLFFSYRLTQNTQFVFDPEIAGGKGFSGVTGLANASNGELPRVASATPKPYVARLYIAHDFGFGSETEASFSDENQLAGARPEVRYTFLVGRFTLTDFFDNNRYSHDPRTQFMGWAVMFNGAWDYPADTRGYTWGWYHEFHARSWSLRYASALEPKVANGLRFDRRILKDRGDVVEGELRYKALSHPGVARLLAYGNRTDSGDYGKAIQAAIATHTIPDVTATRQSGTLKYGFGLNMEQEITKNLGVFGRLGWNDGKTEDFAFTAIDRLATGGISLGGHSWRRKQDTIASEFTASGISAVHQQYLAMGGLDFIIGDGRLSYGPEYIWESYYSAEAIHRLLGMSLMVSLDAQRINNPAYNHDRGPLWDFSLRLHLEAGKEKQ